MRPTEYADYTAQKGEIMEIEEANKVIAEYMGWQDIQDFLMARKLLPFKSLDALVPVWEKLDSLGVMLIISTYKGTHHGWNIETRVAAQGSCEFKMTAHEEYDREKSFSEAACIATAKAIRSLE